MAGCEGDVKYPLGYTATILPGDLRNISMESLLPLRVVGRWFQTPGDFELHFIVTAFSNYQVVRAVPCRTFCVVDWVVRTLLEQGYAVRGTVHSEAKGAHLKMLFDKYGDKLELVVVEDITKVCGY
jgi:hypothetical protein